MSQPSDTPLTDEAERQHAVVAAEFGPMVCSDFARQLEIELATAKAQIEKLVKFADHGIACTVGDSKKPCTCGLSKLLEEIKA